MKFDGDYREQVTLKNGRKVLLRLLRPSDKPQLASGFSKLSDEGRYRRFLSHKNKLSEAELDYLTKLDQQSHFALGAVALVGDDSTEESIKDSSKDSSEGEGLGVARFICIAETPTIADSAITVADGAQGVGLGTLLYRRLVEAALERGVSRFRGEVLANNEAMLRITRGISSSAVSRVAGGVAIVEFDLAPSEEIETPTEPPPGIEYLRMAAENLATVPTFLAWRTGLTDVIEAIETTLDQASPAKRAATNEPSEATARATVPDSSTDADGDETDP